MTKAEVGLIDGDDGDDEAHHAHALSRNNHIRPLEFSYPSNP